MSDAKKVAVKFEYRDNHGDYTSNRLLVFEGELERHGTVWRGSAKPIYAPLQSFALEGRLNFATGKVKIEAQGPIDPNHKSWEPKPAYLWSIEHESNIDWLYLPDIYHGKIQPTKKGDTYQGILDRREGSLVITISEL